MDEVQERWVNEQLRSNPETFYDALSSIFSVVPSGVLDRSHTVGDLVHQISALNNLDRAFVEAGILAVLGETVTLPGDAGSKARSKLARGWGLPESHLLGETTQAYVVGELSPSATQRAEAHIAHCAACSAELAAILRAREAVRNSPPPGVSRAFLASLADFHPPVSGATGVEGASPDPPDTAPKPARRRLRSLLAKRTGVRERRDSGGEAVGIESATDALNTVLNRLGPPPEPLAQAVDSPVPIPQGVS
ncbi:anti-sigma factor family protein [Amycolatopsis sp. RTGN1]|uniref:anti-sigma factor family protein n=1 Tax=Amycolatopsis ponsaeliensis TaxID=2992142 RepID=UPI00254D7AB2|nr:zf-HC2 domain-containing protein [Amycolatopsis sp. RTGN1]